MELTRTSLENLVGAREVDSVIGGGEPGSTGDGKSALVPHHWEDRREGKPSNSHGYGERDKSSGDQAGR